MIASDELKHVIRTKELFITRGSEVGQGWYNICVVSVDGSPRDRVMRAWTLSQARRLGCAPLCSIFISHLRLRVLTSLSDERGFASCTLTCSFTRLTSSYVTSLMVVRALSPSSRQSKMFYLGSCKHLLCLSIHQVPHWFRPSIHLLGRHRDRSRFDVRASSSLYVRVKRKASGFIAGFKVCHESTRSRPNHEFLPLRTTHYALGPINQPTPRPFCS
ncbi:hypothetical protein EDB85DRAFT_1356352 [Lactarius pseudohatsudake]|nr:hypothetical protein EDB85DRAFT_1356352 [Lactarius pseudohatsudake]